MHAVIKCMNDQGFKRKQWVLKDYFDSILCNLLRNKMERNNAFGNLQNKIYQNY